MYQNERQGEIRKILDQEGYVSVQQLSQWLYASPSSIRRDLAALERQGVVRRSYGGAEPVRNSTQILPFSTRAHHNIPAKKTMARKAAQLVPEGAVVFLDQSSSAFFVACELQGRADLTVVSNNVEILSLLSRTELDVISSGGQLSRSNRNCLIGSDAQRTFSQIRADILFFATKALSSEGIVSDCDREEVCLRQIMMENSSQKVYLCAGEKFNHRSAYRQCSLADVDKMITEYTDKAIFAPLGQLAEKIL